MPNKKHIKYHIYIACAIVGVLAYVIAMFQICTTPETEPKIFLFAGIGFVGWILCFGGFFNAWAIKKDIDSKECVES